MSDLQEAPNARNFTEWAALARDNPAAFNELRQRHIEAAIAVFRDSHNIEERILRGWQWRIDAVRVNTRTPLKSCLWVSSMMWDSFHEMRELLDRLVSESRKSRLSNTLSDPKDVTLARVIPFTKPRFPPEES